MASILNTLRFLEKTSFYNCNDSITKEKIKIKHKGMSFVFYKPKHSTVVKYLSGGGIYHDDLVVLGKVTINDLKMMLFYMDLSYHGVTSSGAIYKLGSSIDRLSLNRTIVTKVNNNYNNYYNYNNYNYDTFFDDDD
ncbi:hypothetical protein CPXV_NOR1994_MAN_156 [Cowpox virus]|uniref:Protein OPG159 n=1 Tax=Cowpox virus TaxID=10243 RepID=G0XX93_COWPX|nr:hypothetical protein CPXV_NOR1994_MAN_156 [Cowpox virus]UZC80749.1 V166; CPXV-BR_170 V166 [Cowpox virus]UZC80965.1 V166; CPXV-BR_170 V166 [Cowpox virus]